MTSAVVTFTSRSLEEILSTGGSQAWALNRARARENDFLICTRNRHTDWSEGDEPHQSAFLIGKISDVVPATDSEADAGRWMIKISEFAHINTPEVWKGWRNPVRYMTLDELGIDPSKLPFQPLPDPSDEPPSVQSSPKKVNRVGPLTIAEAKRGLAASLGIAEDAIEITIRG